MTRDLPTKEDLFVENSPFPLTELDKWILAQKDEEFKSHDWEGLRKIIDANDLAAFKRTPADLRRYMVWTRDIKAKYGSMTAYILANRLPKTWGSAPFTPTSAVPFADSSDYKVLLNDWPYALEPGITHLVVWSRTPIPVDSDKGDLTPESRALIQGFVQEHFVDALGAGGKDQVLWFKNWVSLQSVRALEHFHILVRDVDDDTLEKWTGERPRRETQE